MRLTVLTPPRILDLGTLDRVFTIRGHDAPAAALAPPLTAAAGAAAPRVQLRLLAEVRHALRVILDGREPGT